MYIYIHTYIYIYIYVCVYIYIFVHECICIPRMWLYAMHLGEVGPGEAAHTEEGEQHEESRISI